MSVTALRDIALAVITLVLAAELILRAGQSSGMYWLDDYQHLLLSRYALESPRLLVDIWGRPAMTAMYIPAAHMGLGLARATSIALLCVAAAAVWAIQRRQPLALGAVVLLLAQPTTAQLAFGAMPQTLFSAVLGLALLLRERGHVAAAAALASLLPLARLEGVVVVAVWAVALLVESRWTRVPLLGLGIACWWVGSVVAYRDPLWLLHSNSFLGWSQYGRSGWGYGLHATLVTFGIGVSVMAAAGLASRFRDPVVPSIVVALGGFYVAAWGLGAFGTCKCSIYLSSLAVPVALLAHHGLVRMTRVLPTLGVAAVGVFALAGLAASPPLPLYGGPLAAVEMAARLGDRSETVVVFTDPAFGWYGHARPAYLEESFHTLVRRQPDCAAVVWDSFLGPTLGSTLTDLQELGYRTELVIRAGDAKQVLLRRGAHCDPITPGTQGGKGANVGTQRTFEAIGRRVYERRSELLAELELANPIGLEPLDFGVDRKTLPARARGVK